MSSLVNIHLFDTPYPGFVIQVLDFLTRVIIQNDWILVALISNLEIHPVLEFDLAQDL